VQLRLHCLVKSIRQLKHEPPLRYRLQTPSSIRAGTAIPFLGSDITPMGTISDLKDITEAVVHLAEAVHVTGEMLQGWRQICGIALSERLRHSFADALIVVADYWL